MFKTLLTACIVVDGTASGQIPNIVIQPQIPASTSVASCTTNHLYANNYALSCTNMATKSQN